MFLSKNEIFALTGRKQKSKQVNQLQNQNIPFSIDADGFPIVLKASVENWSSTQEEKSHVS